MKKTLTLVISCMMLTYNLMSQYVEIPDTAFRSLLRSQFPNCFNAELQMDTTCHDITKYMVLVLNGRSSDGKVYYNIRNMEGLQYFDSLGPFYCENFKYVEYLPKLPKRLKSIILSNFESLIELPEFSDTVIYIEANRCNLTKLPKLPKYLTGLGVYGNRLTSLPDLPDSIDGLQCGHNLLTSLPKLPKKLEDLWCSNNKIKSIDSLPENLFLLECDSNEITTLPSLSKGLHTLSCQYNKLTCLPLLPSKLNVLKCDYSKIGCIPNRNPYMIVYEGGERLFQQLYFCGSSDSCHGYPKVSGYVFYDQNKNGIKDLGEPTRVSTWPLKNGGYLVTDEKGYYELYADRLGNVNFEISPESKILLNDSIIEATFSSYGTTIQFDVAIEHFKNTVEIPDPNFRTFLMRKYTSCFEMGLMDTTCNQIVGAHSFDFGIWPNSYDPIGVEIKNLEGIQYFKNITSLDCANGNSEGKLEYIPAIPPKVKSFNCQNNKLTSLPPLPDSIGQIFAYNNQITELPKLPEGLYTLSCERNNITSLPQLPRSLRELLANQNSIESLPELPEGLGFLNVADNKINQLPILPRTLITLFVFGNPMVCLPTLPKSLTYLRLDKDKIRCLPNSVENLNVFHAGGMRIMQPLCNPSNNIDHCLTSPSISGKVFIDYNADGVKGQREPFKANTKITLSNGKQVLTDEQGYYQISTDSIGTFVWSVTDSDLYKAVPNTMNFTFLKNDTSIVQDVRLEVLEAKDSLSINLTPYSNAARPGFGYVVKVDYENPGTSIHTPQVTLQYDPKLLVFDSLSHLAPIVNNNKVSFTASELYPGERSSFFAYFKVKVGDILGDTLYAMASILGNNVHHEDTAMTIIRGSYDPNDKQATPIVTPKELALGAFIDYTVRFQNTGTDTAFTVIVRDTLSESLLGNTLKVLDASHRCKTSIRGQVITFEFFNILLVDSNQNEPASHGYVRFRVKPISTLVLDDQVENKAAIYFDFNAPVITNVAVTDIKEKPNNIRVGLTDKLDVQSVKIYPNPASQQVWVQSQGVVMLSIRNLLGEEVLHQLVDKDSPVDISHLKAGVYCYSVEGHKFEKLVVK